MLFKEFHIMPSDKNILTYKKSGVDINAADKFVKFISNISTRKKGKKKLNNIGGFGSISNIPRNLKNPRLLLVRMVLEQKLKSLTYSINLILSALILSL